MRYEIDKNTGFFVLGYGYGSSPTFSSLTVSGATTVGGQLTVNNNAAVNGDLTVSGSFAASGLNDNIARNARAARQGLVFDGTNTGGATMSIPAFGTSDFSVCAWLNVADLSTRHAWIGGETNAFASSIVTSGSVWTTKENVVDNTGSTTLLTAGKFFLVTYTRSGTTGSYYINGVLSNTITDSNNYSVGSTKVGSTTGGAFPFSGQIVGVNAYNRALSASEVVSLFEAGVPSAADYNSASNTLLNTNTALNTFSSAFTTFTGASATGFTGSDTTASKTVRVIFPLSGSLVAGRRYRAKFNATLTAMSSVQLYQSNTAYGGLGAVGYAASGSNEFTFTAASSVDAIMLLCTTDGSVGTHTLVISGMAVDTPGLLLAPEIPAPGNGLLWNDESGNGATIVLPTSGISWNLPSNAQNRVRAQTNTNGNQQLLGATCLPPYIQIVRVRARSLTGTPNVKLGTTSGGNDIVTTVALSTNWKTLSLNLTDPTGSSNTNLWANSNGTDTVQWDISWEPVAAL